MRLLKKHLLAVGLGLSLCTSLSGHSQASCSNHTYIGSICYMAGNFCPKGFMEANGKNLLAMENSALFSVIGSAFGGNAATIVQLPDLTARSPVGMGFSEEEGEFISRGERRGDNSITLDIEHIAQHKHTLPETFEKDFSGRLGARNEAPNINTPTGTMLSKANNTLSPAYKSNAGSLIPMAKDSLYGEYDMSDLKATQPSLGGSQPVYIQGERLALTSCIAVGSNLPYPPRPND